MNDRDRNAGLGLASRIAYALYGLARKTGVMELRAVQWLAGAVYEWVRPKGEVSVEVEGHTLHLKAEDRTITPILLAGEPFEEAEVNLCRKRVRPGMTVVDIGANIGFFSLLFARLTGASGRVVAFEPEPGNFAMLEKNIGANGVENVEAHRVALADHRGTLDLYVGQHSQTTSSLVPGNVLYEDQVDTVAVDVVPLDDFLEARSAGPVDFLKIDVQGFEESVFRGAERTLESSNIAVIMEFWPWGLRRAGTDVDGFLAWLEGFGFTLHVISEDTFEPVATDRQALVSELSYDDRYFINLFLAKGPAAAG